MKISSTNLYDLVHRLTKSEKRYIKVRAGSGQKDYIQLMDALLAQKTFDEAQLARQYKDANFVRHLAVNKRYLYELILQSLSHFGEQSLENKVWERISAAQVLIEKGLYKAAFSELKKGQKIVERYELYELQLMINNVEKKLLSLRQFKSKDDNAVHLIFKQENESVKQLQNSNDYWYLTQQLAQFQMRFQKVQTTEQQQHIEAIIQKPQLNDISMATNFKSRLLFYQANSIYQFMLGDVKQAYEVNKKFLDLLEAQPHFLRIYKERYMGTLNNILIDSLVMGKYERLEEGLNRLAQLPTQPEFKTIKNIEARVFRQRYLLLLNWCLRQNDWKKALEWIPDIETGLAKHGKKIEKHHRITFYYLMGYILFQNGKYDKAINWNNEIINTRKQDVVKEIFYFARVLNVLIHYELGNYTLLESLLSSTPKYLRARRPIYATEKALFRYLGKVLNSGNRKEKMALAEAFRGELSDLSQLPKEQRVFNYLDLRLWMDM